jgi:hypothetical protein
MNTSNNVFQAFEPKIQAIFEPVPAPLTPPTQVPVPTPDGCTIPKACIEVLSLRPSLNVFRL